MSPYRVGVQGGNTDSCAGKPIKISRQPGQIVKSTNQPDPAPPMTALRGPALTARPRGGKGP